MKQDVDRMAKEMLMASARQGRGWQDAAKMALRRRRAVQVAMDILLYAVAAGLAIGIGIAMLVPATGRAWAVGAYRTEACWNDGGAR